MPTDFTNLRTKIQRAISYLENDSPRIIGTEAVKFFKESFTNQGFTDETLEKWEEVERRKPTSEWYGFKYQSRVARPGAKRRKDNSITNYSPAATQRPILSGETQELFNSLRWEKRGRGARITAGTPYAQIQNEGGEITIFGKTKGKIPRRQFMGKSAVLTRRLRSIIKQDLITILR